MNSPARVYHFLADTAAAMHAAFVLFVVGGLVLILLGWIRGWNWTRDRTFRTVHLASIGFVVLEAWFGIPCPLTVLENKLRTLAGNGTYEMSFIGYWLNRLLFYSAPEWVFTMIYSLFAVTVAMTFLAYPPKRS